MNFMHKVLIFLALLWAVSMPARCATWEETDGRYFEQGDLAAVKRLLAKENYSGDLLIQAFETAAMSGHMDLVQYLDKRGWLEICRHDKRCDPVLYAVIGKKFPKMVAYLLSRGFSPTRSALFSASATVTPDDETLASSLEAVKILCEQGANPAERDGPTVLEELEKRITAQSMDLGTPLRSARGTAAEIQVAEFFKKGACKKGAAAATDFEDYRALVRAMRQGSISTEGVTTLDTKRFQPQVERYLLYEAIVSGRLDFLTDLKRRGWFSRCRENASCRPLDVAAEVGADLQILQFLASEGFEIDGRNASGGSPLMYATLHAHADAVKFLCEHGADYRKPVKLEIYERSIISILRRSYSSAWCGSVIFGAYTKPVQDAARMRCEGEGGVLGDSQSSIALPECMPGSACMSIPFSPKGPQGEPRELKTLAEMFQYFKSGACKPAQSAPACTSDVATKAVLMGDNVHLRAEPSMSSAKAGTLPFGTVVDVLDPSRACESLSAKAGRWIKVKVLAYPTSSQLEQPLIEGWVFDAYVDYFPSFEP
ncbi:hypothetical protein MIZ03_0230 [Rhodoferax lithotrophicus]|uniref:SH3b domain-containing protein n=1 Tax=Rhodoferax lithotrophicus TaxID=2798804 RepID=A0ABM7MGN6_9BURK|nr:ankyrin repeat domain-containing protein [Rhodoferax sp. MIZ03]BCO25370.1 hypothetical protein MIZ03_0230 [Rhodoferax sp. MIZ03]